MTPVEILTKARALIEDPGCWTQEALARDSEGEECDYDSEDVACFCAYGATGAVVGALESMSADSMLDEASAEMGFYSADELNDKSDHPTVIRMFDLAIEKARAALAKPEGV